MGAKKPRTLTDETDNEFMWLQLRKVVELVAFAGISSDEARYAALRAEAKDNPDYTRDWKVGDIFTAVSALHDLDVAERRLAESIGRGSSGFSEMLDERRTDIELKLRRQLEYQLMSFREAVEEMKPHSPMDKQTTRALAEPRVLEAHPKAVVDVSSSHLVRVTLPPEEIAQFMREAERAQAAGLDVLDDDWFRPLKI